MFSSSQDEIIEISSSSSSLDNDSSESSQTIPRQNVPSISCLISSSNSVSEKRLLCKSNKRYESQFTLVDYLVSKILVKILGTDMLTYLENLGTR